MKRVEDMFLLKKIKSFCTNWNHLYRFNIYSITNVNYSIENWRVEQKAILKNWFSEIQTDSSIAPKDL
jgi:hypothetical protein